MTVRLLKIVGANAERSRSHNRQMVLGRIRAGGRMGRAEIARASGLSTQAVSNIIADLLEDGLILEQGRRASTRGQPPVQYGLNAQGGYAFGVEVRPDAVLAALIDFAGETVFTDRRPLPASDRDTVTARVKALKSAALRRTGVSPDRLLGAGLVMPGPFGATGITGHETELSGWANVDPHAWFSDALDLPVFVENDANAAAMAERVSGAAMEVDSFAYLYFGAGLGLGVLANGQLIAGAYGNAGEIGHIPVPCDGKTVPLEEAVSRLSLQRSLTGVTTAPLQQETLAELFAAEDPALMAWLDRAAEPLSAAIEIIENIFDPQTVILGGAMPDNLLDRLIMGVDLPRRSVANRPDRALPRLTRGTSGRMTATLGAAALVINRAVTPSIAAVP
ncbi:MAG: ROK family transcriptional regulator [Pseudomonadota bacterium]